MGKTVSRTDIGLKRKLNQDYVFTADLPVGKLPNLYLVSEYLKDTVIWAETE